MSNTQSADFTTQQKLDALLAALNAGAITQAQYNTQYALLTNPPQPFSIEAFWDKLFSVLNPVHWLNDLATFFNIRILLIALAIGAAFWFGLRDRIPVFSLGPGSLQGKTFTMNLGDGRNLTLQKSGQLQVTDAKTGKVQKTIRVKDIKELEKAIDPIGFELKPFLVGGMGIGQNGAGPEVGAGAHIFHVYNWQTDAMVTSGGAYLGESYRLSKFLDGNTSVGIAAGPQWKGGFGALVYMTIDF